MTTTILLRTRDEDTPLLHSYSVLLRIYVYVKRDWNVYDFTGQPLFFDRSCSSIPLFFIKVKKPSAMSLIPGTFVLDVLIFYSSNRFVLCSYFVRTIVPPLRCFSTNRIPPLLHWFLPVGKFLFFCFCAYLGYGGWRALTTLDGPCQLYRDLVFFCVKPVQAFYSNYSSTTVARQQCHYLFGNG